MARSVREQEIEVFPEADRLGDFPHPRMTGQLIGHEEQVAMLRGALDGSACHHAWLIAGPEGVGKATLAYAAARYALATPAERGTEAGDRLGIDPRGRTARQVAALSHPGLLVIRRAYDPKDKRFRAVITIDEVRRLKGFLSHTGGSGGRRVVIVDAMDELNIAAANALLKSLEEPPPGTLFLLVTSEPGRLLATIRSRCRLLTVGRLSDGETRAAAEAAAQAADEPIALDQPPEWENVLAAASGSVRRCLMLLGGEGTGAAAAARQAVALLPKVDWSAANKLADDLASPANATAFEMFFSVLLDQMAAVARAGAGVGGDDMQGRLGRRLAEGGRLASWAELWESIAADKSAAVALNLDRRTLVLETLERLSETVNR